MIQQLLDIILSQTYTQADALSRLQALKDLILFQLFQKGKEVSDLHAPEHSNPQTAWLISIGTDFYKLFNRQNVYTLFDSLEAEIKKLKPLIVYLPIDLPEEAVTELGQYTRQMFGKNFLIDLKVDPTLLAGTALVWNGIYRDYSIRKKIEDNRTDIIKMLREEIKR